MYGGDFNFPRAKQKLKTESCDLRFSGKLQIKGDIECAALVPS